MATAGHLSSRCPRRLRRRKRHPNDSATATASSGKGNRRGRPSLVPVTAAARRRDDSATRVATVASEPFVHAVPSLCCVASTMFPTGQPVGVLKCLVTITFATNPIRLRFFNLLAALAERDFGQPKISEEQFIGLSLSFKNPYFCSRSIG